MENLNKLIVNTTKVVYNAQIPRRSICSFGKVYFSFLCVCVCVFVCMCVCACVSEFREFRENR